MFKRAGKPKTLPELGLPNNIRHGVAVDRERTIKDQRENIGERQRASVGRRNVCCLRACEINCDCAIAILNHLEFVACSSRSTVRLCETPRTVTAVIRATALP